MEDINLGQVVHSKAGRDKDKYFVVIDIVDDDYVLIADGELRKVNSPKKKKIKHLVFHDRIAESVQQSLKENKRLTDSDIKKSLQSMGLI